jgi:hypothetical protein
MAAMAPSPADQATWLKLASEWLAMSSGRGVPSDARVRGKQGRQSHLIPLKFRCHTLIASLLHIDPDTVKREKIAIGFPVTTFITHDFYPFPAFKVVCRCCDGPLLLT